MAREILSLLADRPAPRPSGQAQQSVRDRFSWPQLVADQGSLYEDVAAPSAGAGPGGAAGEKSGNRHD